MDIKDIQELIKFVAKSGATEVNLEIDNVKISIKSPPKKRRGQIEEPIQIVQPHQAKTVEVVSPTVTNTTNSTVTTENNNEKIPNNEDESK